LSDSSGKNNYETILGYNFINDSNPGGIRYLYTAGFAPPCWPLKVSQGILLLN